MIIGKDDRGRFSSSLPFSFLDTIRGSGQIRPREDWTDKWWKIMWGYKGGISKCRRRWWGKCCCFLLVFCCYGHQCRRRRSRTRQARQVRQAGQVRWSKMSKTKRWSERWRKRWQDWGKTECFSPKWFVTKYLSSQVVLGWLLGDVDICLMGLWIWALDSW